MDGRSGLLTFGAYLVAAAVIVVVASVGLIQYSVRVPPPPTGMALSQLDLAGNPARRRVAAVELPQATELTAEDQQRRIQVMEQLLTEKNQRLREQSQQLKAASRRLEQLRTQYDEAMNLAMEVLARNNGAQGDPENDPDARGAEAPDRAKLETELAMAEAVQKKLLIDLEELQTELVQANQELTRLRAATPGGLPGAVDEQVVLEAATAEVLVAVGAPAVPSLVKALDHRNPLVRRWAATVLGSIGADAEDAVAALTETLSDTNVEVRNAARAALEAIER